MAEEDGAPAEAEGPSRVERIFIRISIMQTVLAAAGIFTGAVALYAALNEADAVRKQQQAMVWPDVLVGSSFRPEPAPGGGAPVQAYSLIVVNSGIGPAQIRGVRITVDGQAQPRWRAVLAALDESPPDYSYDLMSGRTLLSGQRVEVLTVADDTIARSLRTKINDQSRLTIEACYCSVFEDCWTVGFFTRPEPVNACPDYGDAAFLE